MVAATNKEIKVCHQRPYLLLFKLVISVNSVETLRSFAYGCLKAKGMAVWKFFKSPDVLQKEKIPERI